MEPTIYKPSIYKGAGVYKTGAGGGVCEGKALEASGKACSAPGRSRTW